MNNINIVYNNNTISVGMKVVTSIDYLNRRYLSNDQSTDINIDLPANVANCHFIVLIKILEKQQLLPMVDLQSYADLYAVLRLTQIMEISAERIFGSFKVWFTNNRWIELLNPEYMYLIYELMEELVDYKQFFYSSNNPFAHLSGACVLPEVQANPELYIRMLIFYKNYPLKTIFTNNNNEVQDKIDILNKQRSEVWWNFMVNPHLLGSYFIYLPNSYPVWSCEGISTAAPPMVGRMTIAPQNEAIERFHKFTFDLLRKSPNPESGPFPFNNVTFAGGSIAKILGAEYNINSIKQSDCDIFVHANTFEEREMVFEQVLRWFATPNTYYAIRGSIVTIYIKNISRKFQIISQNVSTSYDIIERFDFTHVQWVFQAHTGTFYGMPEACKSMKEQVTYLHNTKRIKTDRMIKALYRGYSIYKNDKILDVTDISDLIAHPAKNVQLQKIIRGFFKWYYPVSQPDMDPEEEHQHILSMIERDSNAMFVDTNVKFVLDNIIISGNFENDYESNVFSNFNMSTIEVPAMRVGYGKQTIRNKFGQVYITTGILNVDEIIVNETGVEIFCKLEDEAFRVFIEQMENQVFRLYASRGREVTRHIINNTTGRIRFFMPHFKLVNQVVRGKSCMKSQRGAALNIEEDLRENDQIQVLFNIDIIISENDKAVEFRPMKFVKFCKHDPEQVRQLEIADKKMDEEIDLLATGVEFEASINYDNGSDKE